MRSSFPDVYKRKWHTYRRMDKLFAPISWQPCWIPAMRYGTNLCMEPLSWTEPETPWATFTLSPSLENTNIYRSYISYWGVSSTSRTIWLLLYIFTLLNFFKPFLLYEGHINVMLLFFYFYYIFFYIKNIIFIFQKSHISFGIISNINHF